MSLAMVLSQNYVFLARPPDPLRLDSQTFLRLQMQSKQLRKLQQSIIALVAGKLHLAFIAVGVILASWPHTALPMLFVKGFNVVGKVKAIGIYKSVQLEISSASSGALDPGGITGVVKGAHRVYSSTEAKGRRSGAHRGCLRKGQAGRVCQ